MGAKENFDMRANDAMIIVSNDRLDTAGQFAIRFIELQRGLSQLQEVTDPNAIEAAQKLVEVAMHDMERDIAAVRNRIQNNRNQAYAMLQRAFDLAVAEMRPAEVHSINDREVRKLVLAMTGGVCTYCAVPLTDGQPVEGQSTKLYVEHVIPSSKGGPDNLCNYVPSCGSCNSAKGDRHVLHFVRKVQPLREQATNVVPMMKGAES